MDVAKAAERLTVDDPHGWYLSETETRGRTVTRAYYWNGVELRGYPDGHFLVEMRNHRNFRGPMIVAEHPADSELAIDEPWLRSVGFLIGMELDIGDGFTLESIGSNLWLTCDEGSATKQVKNNPTRGDVRRLAAALGIQLATP